MSVITRINRFGRDYHVALACGHSLRVTPEEVRQHQLFVGKRVLCIECESARLEEK